MGASVWTSGPDHLRSGQPKDTQTQRARAARCQEFQDRCVSCSTSSPVTSHGLGFRVELASRYCHPILWAGFIVKPWTPHLDRKNPHPLYAACHNALDQIAHTAPYTDVSILYFAVARCASLVLLRAMRYDYTVYFVVRCIFPHCSAKPQPPKHLS